MNILLPILGFLIVPFLPLPAIAKGVIIIELTVPMAVNNINLSSLYDCKPKAVTELVFGSSLVFIGVLPVVVWGIGYL